MSDIAFLVMIFCAKFTKKSGLRGLLRGSFFFSTEMYGKIFFQTNFRQRLDLRLRV